MRVIHFCIHHPITTGMVTIFLTLVGLLGLISMKVELLPNISIPTLVVVTQMARAGAPEIEEKITTPLEEALNSVSGLKKISSRSEEGVSLIQLEFAWGTEIELKSMEVKERLYKLVLPKEAETPYLWRWNPASQPVFRCDIYDNDNRLTLAELKELVEKTIKPRLERIQGIGAVNVLGGEEQEYKVLVSRSDLLAKHVTVLQIIETIQRENKTLKAGKIESGRYTCQVRVAGKATQIRELENLVVASYRHPDTQELLSVKLKDVASITDSMAEITSKARINGRASIGISITKASSGNTVELIKLLRNELERLRQVQAIPPHVRIEISRDDSEYILQSQNIVLSNIFWGCVLAAIFVLLLVRDLRASILLGISIPFSLIAAFSLLYVFGLSRNVLTLGGMALASGMVLDASIVVVENIYRHLGYGRKPEWAAWEGTGEVVMGTVASGLTTILAFLPLLLLPGILLEIFRDLSLAIIAAIFFSCILGLSFMPMMAARMVKAPTPLKEIKGIKGIILRFLSAIDSLLEWLLAAILKALLATSWRRLTFFILLLSLCLLSIWFLPSQDFIPRGKVKELQITIEAPPTASLGYVDAKASEIEAMLKSWGSRTTSGQEATIATVTTEVERRQAVIFAKVAFTPLQKDGKTTTDYTRQDLFEVLEALRLRLRTYARDTKIFANMVDKVNPRGDAPFQIVITPKNIQDWPIAKVQNYLQQKIIPRLADTPGAIYVRLAQVDFIPELDINLNKKAMQNLGGDTTLVSYTVRCFIDGFVPTSLNVDGKIIPVRVQGVEAERSDVDTISQIPVPTRLGTIVKIKDLGTLAPTEIQSHIEHSNRRPAILLKCEQIPYAVSGKTLGDIMTHIDTRLKDPDFPPDAPGGQKFSDLFFYDYESQSKDLHDSAKSALLALLIAIVLIYMVLCCQFESITDPFVIMLTVPLSFPGIALLLHLTKEEYSLSAMVGFICLAGIVVNNGIMLLEFVNILRRRGYELKEALVEASQRKLKSILISSLTSIFGMLPIVFGLGEGSELYRGCCAVILGGLLVSTPLTLVGVPILYVLMEQAKEFGAMHTLRWQIWFERQFK